MKPQDPLPVGVRGSCGFLMGILLHRDLGEPLCGACALAEEQLGREKAAREAEAALAAAQRASVDTELSARVVRAGKERNRRDYKFPGELA